VQAETVETDIQVVLDDLRALVGFEVVLAPLPRAESLALEPDLIAMMANLPETWFEVELELDRPRATLESVRTGRLLESGDIGPTPDNDERQDE
jgi:hypothetical protein